MTVYLSGPIYPGNKTANEEWRLQARDYLMTVGVGTTDPCRNKTVYTYGSFTPNEIIFRDLKDIDAADLLLANFNLIGDKLPIGTVMEIQHAWETKKPVVIVSDDKRVTGHPWLQAMSVKIFWDLDEALEYIASFWHD